MVSPLDSVFCGPVRDQARSTYFVQRPKLYSHSASFHPGVKMGAGELSGKPDEMLGVTL